MTHERTPLGRELLSLQRYIRAWIALNTGRESVQAIEAAEYLGCHVADAAWNSLAIAKEGLRRAANRMASHHYSRSQGGRRG